MTFHLFSISAIAFYILSFICYGLKSNSAIFVFGAQQKQGRSMEYLHRLEALAIGYHSVQCLITASKCR